MCRHKRICAPDVSSTRRRPAAASGGRYTSPRTSSGIPRPVIAAMSATGSWKVRNAPSGGGASVALAAARASRRSISPSSDDWHLDERVPADEQAGPELYARNDLDRGHLVRRRDPVWGADAEARQANYDTFSYANAAPQAADFNQSKELWNGLEDHVLAYAETNELRLSVFTGPVFADDDALSIALDGAFADVPDAHEWALSFTANLSPLDDRVIDRMCDSILRTAVVGLAEACVPDADDRMLALLESAIAEVAPAVVPDATAAVPRELHFAR